MQRIQIYICDGELVSLREAAWRSRRSVSDLVREAIRKAVPKLNSEGPVAIWGGEPKRASVDHDAVYDEP